MHDILVVYDNSIEPSTEICNIIGEKTFGEVILQRQTLQQHFYSAVAGYPYVHKQYFLESVKQIPRLLNALQSVADDMPVLHVFADSIVWDKDEMGVLMEKTRYVQQNIFVERDGVRAAIFGDMDAYVKHLEHSVANKATKAFSENMAFEALRTDALAGIGDTNSFVQHITRGFDSRYFNTLEGDAYVIAKRSANKEKIKGEYQYYHLLPDGMKMWFVLPFDYSEDDAGAQYSMKRYHMTDLAIKWVNGSIDTTEFEKIMDMVFYFINSRASRETSPQDYRAAADALYLDKLRQRRDELKACAEYPAIADFIARGTEYNSFDDIVDEYEKLYSRRMEQGGFRPVSVIGHGDLCFANMLYYGDTSTMKFIDVKGATKEEDLWTDPYYDLAKLSHSICGYYDLFNSNLYEVALSADLRFELSMDFKNPECEEIFRNCLRKNGFDDTAVRLFEASLFLSMLPLHIDYPKKVFGFILNAINIMKEVEACLNR